MGIISSCELPPAALLGSYVKPGNYTDCYVTRVKRSLTLADYISAFYSTPLFAAERMILKWAVAKPSSRNDIEALANAQTEQFAAWFVEARSATELLLKDYRGRTRCWQKCEALGAEEQSAETRLYFGSAVVFAEPRERLEKSTNATFRALLPFHKLYSRGLLWSARRSLIA